MLRRGPDPLEMASVLQRLERLQVVPPSAGWLPSAPAAAPLADAAPAASAVAASAVAASDDAARPSVARRSLPASLRARALDPGRRGVAVLAALALCGAGGGAWYFVHAAPHAVPSTDAAAATDGAVGADSVIASTGPDSSIAPVATVGSPAVASASADRGRGRSLSTSSARLSGLGSSPCPQTRASSMRSRLPAAHYRAPISPRSTSPASWSTAKRYSSESHRRQVLPRNRVAAWSATTLAALFGAVPHRPSST